MKYQNDDNDNWNEPKPIMTDKQFVVVVIIAALIFTALFLYKYYEPNTNENKTTGQRAYKCLHNK